MSAVESSGTQTAVISTEHSLAAPSTAKTRTLTVDLTNMVNDDRLELRVKLKVLTGGTVRTTLVKISKHDPGGAGSPEIFQSVPVWMPFGGDFTLKQTAGTGRDFDWAVATHD